MSVSHCFPQTPSSRRAEEAMRRYLLCNFQPVDVSARRIHQDVSLFIGEEARVTHNNQAPVSGQLVVHGRGFSTTGGGCWWWWGEEGGGSNPG